MLRRGNTAVCGTITPRLLWKVTDDIAAPLLPFTLTTPSRCGGCARCNDKVGERRGGTSPRAVRLTPRTRALSFLVGPSSPNSFRSARPGSECQPRSSFACDANDGEQAEAVSRTLEFEDGPIRRGTRPTWLGLGSNNNWEVERRRPVQERSSAGVVQRQHRARFLPRDHR